ncbi:hypothetical protein ACIRQY_29100 [Streptomyces sp. NPDC101490]|uniref:hypothetical protein n=1 Tax=Streptomyces sp. NPDC101490 TaxID=3366143 RepID=UPI0037FF3E67
MATPTTPTATRVRRGVFTLQAEGEESPTVFSCQPTSVVLTPEAGDVGDALEVLCGTSIPGQAAPTKWTMALTSIQSIETTDTASTSLVMYALEHDGETVKFTFQPSPTAKVWTGRVTVVAISIGGEVGGTAPTSEAEWPMDGPPTEQKTPPAAGKTLAGAGA